MLTITVLRNCGVLTMASPVPSSGQRAHSSCVTSLVVAMSASRLCMDLKVCTNRVLHSSKISGGRWPGCWLTNAIANQLRELSSAPDKRGVIVDLSAVQFAASIAIGQLIVNAQAVKGRGGHLVLIVSEYSAVMISLRTSGIDKVIPVFQYATDAYVGALRGF